MAVHKNILAEKELIKHFRHAQTFLAQIPSKNKYVNNDVIKLTEIGADPEVLINNTTYPIDVVSRTDDSVAISLYKFDTKNTKVTDDEKYGLPYDKDGSVQQQHRETLEEVTAEMALHSLAVQANTSNTPVLETTGENNGAGRKRLVTKDLVVFKRKLDELKVPLRGRMLVLAPEHVEDLLIEDRDRFKNTFNEKTGALSSNLYGFEVYEFVYSPSYAADGTKKAFGAAAVAGDRNGSTFIYKKNAIKARGSVTKYERKAKESPEYRESVVGFRLYHIAIPIKNTGFGAIISAAV